MPKLLSLAFALVLLLAGPALASSSSATAATTAHAVASAAPTTQAAQSAQARGAAKRFVKKWYRVANHRQWKRLKRMSAPGVVKDLRSTIRFAKSYHGVNLLPFGHDVRCYAFDAPRIECYSERDDPLGVVVERHRGAWRVAWVQLYD